MAFPLSMVVFVERFPRFAATATERPAFVQSKLDDAAAEIDERVWGANAEKGHGNLAAALLEEDPHGADARLDAKDEDVTTYRREFNRLVEIVGVGIGL